MTRTAALHVHGCLRRLILATHEEPNRRTRQVGSLSVSDITRILQIAGLAIAILVVLLILVRLLLRILRHLFRKSMNPDNTDLIGQEAVVRRTIRRQRPGEIECEWKGQILSGKALSDTTVRTGRIVLIVAVQGEYFKVRPQEMRDTYAKQESDAARYQ